MWLVLLALAVAVLFGIKAGATVVLICLGLGALCVVGVIGLIIVGALLQ